MPTLEHEIERGIRTSGRAHPWSGDEPDLTDIEGVGPATADKLRAAGVSRPSDLQGKGIDEIAAIEGIGRQRAARIRAQVEHGRPGDAKRAIVTEDEDDRQLHGFVHTSRRVDPQPGGETGAEDTGREIDFWGGKADVPVVPGTVNITGDDKDEALAQHADRTTEARRADESFNAPVTLSYPQWAANPNRFDYPGVDTIPRSRRRQRALERTKRLVDEGDIKHFQTMDTWSSAFNRGTRNLKLGQSRDPEGAFAHELGHAVEAAIPYSSSSFEGREPSHRLFSDPESIEQAERISERRRGEPIESTRRIYGIDVLEGTEWERDTPKSEDEKAREFKEELFADVFAGLVTEPRATRREAPKAVREVESVVHATGHLRREPWPDLEGDI